jgi:hypothetical protein
MTRFESLLARALTIIILASWAYVLWTVTR